MPGSAASGLPCGRRRCTQMVDSGRAASPTGGLAPGKERAARSSQRSGLTRGPGEGSGASGLPEPVAGGGGCGVKDACTGPAFSPRGQEGSRRRHGLAGVEEWARPGRWRPLPVARPAASRKVVRSRASRRAAAISRAGQPPPACRRTCASGPCAHVPLLVCVLHVHVCGSA